MQITEQLIYYYEIKNIACPHFIVFKQDISFEIIYFLLKLNYLSFNIKSDLLLIMLCMYFYAIL